MRILLVAIGEPGCGKSFIIKALQRVIDKHNFTVTSVVRKSDYHSVEVEGSLMIKTKKLKSSEV